MYSVRKILLTLISHIGQAIPKNILRRIADFPGVLRIFDELSTGEFIETPTPDGCNLVINPLFHSILIESSDLRGYEPDIREIILKFTKPGMVAYDIGANVGVFSFQFASLVGRDGKVYSFEPEENNYICLERSLENYQKKNILLDKRAISNLKSTEKFDRRGGAFSGRLIGNGQYNTTSNIKIVETVSIDYLIKEEGYDAPDILKIDVEGNEGMVLEGMKNTLKEFDPIIICELHTHLGESSEQVVNLLSSYGYTISNVKDVLAGNHVNDKLSSNNLERHIVAIKSN